MPNFYSWAKPVLWQMPPERAHRLTLAALCRAPAWTLPDPGSNDGLGISVWGRDFSSPIGLAAGFDKDAVAVPALYKLGFGFVEVGGVTLHPQPGNPLPRLFRLSEDRAIINRMGLNSGGADAVVEHLARHSSATRPGPLVVNCGLNKGSETPEADYAMLAEKLAPFVDVITVNVSSPNTPGLRALQNPDALRSIIDAVRTSVAALTLSQPPAVLVKLAPDLLAEDIAAIASLALNESIDGLVISNTTTARPDSLKSPFREEAGGLSGAPLMQPSTDLLRTMYERTHGRIPLIGVGGLSSGADAYAKIRAGASLVQLYSALVFEGPGLIAQIKADLQGLLAKDGFASVADAVGADHSAGSMT